MIEFGNLDPDPRPHGQYVEQIQSELLGLIVLHAVDLLGAQECVEMHLPAIWSIDAACIRTLSCDLEVILAAKSHVILTAEVRLEDVSVFGQPDHIRACAVGLVTMPLG